MPRLVRDYILGNVDVVPGPGYLMLLLKSTFSVTSPSTTARVTDDVDSTVAAMCDHIGNGHAHEMLIHGLNLGEVILKHKNLGCL